MQGLMIGLAAMVYEPLYHAREIETIKLCCGCSCKAERARSSNIFVDIYCSFYIFIDIPLVLVGCETITANLVLCTSLVICHLISSTRLRNNVVIVKYIGEYWGGGGCLNTTLYSIVLPSPPLKLLHCSFLCDASVL